MLIEDFEEFCNVFSGISGSDVGDVANVPNEIATAKRDESNVLEMICSSCPIVLLKYKSF